MHIGVLNSRKRQIGEIKKINIELTLERREKARVVAEKKYLAFCTRRYPGDRVRVQVNDYW